MLSALFCIFVISSLVTVYVLWGYPLLVSVLVWCKRQRAKESVIEVQSALPFVTVVVPCFNESSRVEKKAENVFSTSYPHHLFEVFFVDSSSTDDTFSRIIALKDHCPVMAYQSNPGKTNALNTALEQAKGEVIVTTDCDVTWEPNALESLVCGLISQELGAVCATPELVSPLFNSKERYHSDDWRVRKYESELDTCSSLDARLMAFRAKTLSRLPADTVIDDFELTLLLRCRGERSAVLSDVMVYEKCPATIRGELAQLRRRAVSVILLVWKYRRLLFNPKYGCYGMLILPSRRLGPLILAVTIPGIVVAALVLWPIEACVAGLIIGATMFLKRDFFRVLQLLALYLAWIDVFCGRNPNLQWGRDE